VIATPTNGNVLNPIFVGWAASIADYYASPGAAGWNATANALGPVTGDHFDVVSLGDMNTAQLAAYNHNIAPGQPGYNGPGYITLAFATPITNGPGADFVVFENCFTVVGNSPFIGGVAGQIFAELAFVEVSTDGVNFARFPSEYLNFPNARLSGRRDNYVDLDGTGTPRNISALSLDVSGVYNLAGKHINNLGDGLCWGTPFDLDDLRNDPLVLDGTIKLNKINFVRIVDIPGNGDFLDSLGNPIFDAWVTGGSGGFDLAGIGVIHQVPEPTSLGLLLVGGWGLLTRYRRRPL
jgi:hypothetical protein